MVTRPISIAEFEEAPKRSRGPVPSPLVLAIRALRPGQAFAYPHECGATDTCRAQSLVGNQRPQARLKGFLYLSRHLVNGDLGVACYEAEEVKP